MGAMNNDKDVANCISLETLFVAKIFAIKHNIEVPDLYLMNYIPKDRETTTKEYEPVLYIFKPDGSSIICN